MVGRRGWPSWLAEELFHLLTALDVFVLSKCSYRETLGIQSLAISKFP